MLDIHTCLLCFCLIKGTLESPLNANWISHTLHKNLVMHCFFSELCEVSMAILDVRVESTLIEINVIHFTHLREILVQESHYVPN